MTRIPHTLTTLEAIVAKDKELRLRSWYWTLMGEIFIFKKAKIHF
jgi:hypothetical protein